MLQADGPASLSARRVSEAAGTSTGALYEFFGDKAGLVRALYSESLALLDARQAAIPTTADAERELVEWLAATRRFALDQPMLYQLMSSRPFAEFDPSKDDSEIAGSIYRRGVTTVGRYLAQVQSTARPRLAAELVVATHRGLIDAELTGRLGRSPTSRERKYRLGVLLILDGISAMTADA